MHKLAIITLHICTIIVTLQIIILLLYFILSHSQTLSLSLLLSSFSSSAQPINHLPTTTQSMQPTTTILQHIKIQPQIQ